MCKIIEALNTISKLHANLSEKMNIVMDSEIFNTSNSLTTLFYLDKYSDINKVAEATENDVSFVIFNCNNLARAGLIQNNSKKDSIQFAITKNGRKFLEQNIQKLTYFQQFEEIFANITFLQNKIKSIDVSSFINNSESQENDIKDQFMVI
jgi:hypothetical protein